ncbi:hypothetical protein B9G55_21955 [Saccharibacillus sp. O16]|nr:hypothetical protein B9G55_21955 [Saccharibacillus sp. O16]
MFKCLSHRLLSLLLVAVIALSALSLPPAGRAAAADNGWSAALSSMDVLYDGYTALETANKIEKQAIQSLRKDSEARLKTIHTALTQIDKTKIARLAADSTASQNKHAALLKQYSDLGKQAAEARKRKDKKSADMLDLKRNQLKPSVDAAKSEIKRTKEALASAKKQAAAKAKMVRDALAPATALKKQVTEENKSIAAANKTRAASYKRYRAAVKSGGAITAAAELTLMYAQLDKIHLSQQKIYSWEKQILAAVQAAAAKLPV